MTEYGVEAFYLRHGYRRSNKFQIYWKVIPIYLLKILKANVYYLITPLSCKYIMLFLIIRLWKKIVLLLEWRFHYRLCISFERSTYCLFGPWSNFRKEMMLFLFLNIVQFRIFNGMSAPYPKYLFCKYEW